MLECQKQNSRKTNKSSRSLAANAVCAPNICVSVSDALFKFRHLNVWNLKLANIPKTLNGCIFKPLLLNFCTLKEFRGPVTLLCTRLSPVQNVSCGVSPNWVGAVKDLIHDQFQTVCDKNLTDKNIIRSLAPLKGILEPVK